jgi:hypothetical protein
MEHCVSDASVSVLRPRFIASDCVEELIDLRTDMCPLLRLAAILEEEDLAEDPRTLEES